MDFKFTYVSMLTIWQELLFSMFDSELELESDLSFIISLYLHFEEFHVSLVYLSMQFLLNIYFSLSLILLKGHYLYVSFGYDAP